LKTLLFSIFIIIVIFFTAPSLVQAAGRNQLALETRDLCLAPAGQNPTPSASVEPFFTAIAARCQVDPAEERLWLEYLAAGGDRPEIVLASQPENLPLANITASLFPHNPVVYYQFGELLIKNGEKERALLAYWRVAVLSPLDGRNWVRLARLYEAQGDWQTALIFFNRGCILHDTGSNGCTNAGRLYLAHGFPADAERCFRTFLMDHPNYNSITLVLAQALYLQDRYEEAHQLLQPLVDAGNQKAVELLQQYQTSPGP
jgi:tetratricopeptide (TPR) repeat protein